MAKELLDLVCEIFEENKRPAVEIRKEWEELTAKIEKPSVANESYKQEYKKFDITKMTDEELEDTALEMADFEWQLRARGHAPYKEFDDVLNHAREYLKNERHKIS